jgi:hypothetical protein
MEGVETILELRNRSADAPIVAMSGGGRMDASDPLEIADNLGTDRTMNVVDVGHPEEPFAGRGKLRSSLSRFPLMPHARVHSRE